MKKFFTLLFFFFILLVGFSQVKTGSISQPTVVTAKLTILSPRGSIEVPNATLSNQALPKGQADGLYAPKTVATTTANGLMSNTDKAKLDSTTTLPNGTNGQVLTIVSGSPAFATPASGGTSSAFAVKTAASSYTGQALQNIPALSITLAANSTYEFEAVLITIYKPGCQCRNRRRNNNRLFE